MKPKDNVGPPPADAQSVLDGLETHLQGQLSGRVRGMRVLMRDNGLVIEGRARSYHAKQLAQHLLMRATDLIMTFPALILAITIAALHGPDLTIVIYVVALVNTGPVARVVYTETTSLAEREFIAAERAIGAGTARILFRHILPHLLPIIIVWGTLGISTSVLLEATLSFLGSGVRPPEPSWGNIVFDGQSYFQTAPWLVFIPGFAVALLALAVNLVGDALRDLLDPTLRGRH